MLMVTLRAFAYAEESNLLLILAENVKWGDLDAYGGGKWCGMPTPRIDQLAAAAP